MLVLVEAAGPEAGWNAPAPVDTLRCEADEGGSDEPLAPEKTTSLRGTEPLATEVAGEKGSTRGERGEARALPPAELSDDELGCVDMRMPPMLAPP